METTTLYMPVSDRLGWTNRHSDVLDREVMDWLELWVGRRAPSYLNFLADLDRDLWDWCWGGKAHDPRDLRVCFVLTFKDPRKAMMFKLAWG